jgi:hypothetical protein
LISKAYRGKKNKVLLDPLPPGQVIPETSKKLPISGSGSIEVFRQQKEEL